MGPSAHGPARLHYIDTIRILLICLVIANHTAITYGAHGDWYFSEDGDAVASALLTVMNSINQAFFMGFFFLISAYFIPASLDRKGVPTYLRDRFLRLGVPLVVWVLLLNPLLIYIVGARVYGFQGSLLDSYYMQFVPFHGFELGLMWFVFTLFVFTLCYIAWRMLGRDTARPLENPSTVPFPPFRYIVLFGLGIGIVTALVRFFFPIGYSFKLFNLQFPFFPQYIAFFIVGLYAARQGWFTAIPPRTGKLCAAVALLLLAIEPVFLLLAGAASGSFDLLLGGLHWQAVLYALWEQMAGVMIIVGLLWLFSTRVGEPGPLARASAAGTYTVYIIHPAVLIPVSLALQGLMLPALLKFGLVLGLVIVLSFMLAHGIRALPGAKSIL